MDTLDIFRSAKIFIAQHGKLALNEAIKQAAELRVAGDNAGSDVWLSISDAILWLETDHPVHGESTQ